MYRFIALIIGYSIGCIQTAYIIGRINGIDIRDHGSKNAGMTNVTRTLGKKAGAFVFVVDILKAAVAFGLATWIYMGSSWLIPYREAYVWISNPNLVQAYNFPGVYAVLPGLYAAIGAVLGHCFPVILKFRGGKGVSCAIGLILMFDWRVALISYAMGFIAVCATRYISLASLVITLSAAIATAIFAALSLHSVESVALMFGLAVLIWFLHRENIGRIVTGKERKFLEKKDRLP